MNIVVNLFPIYEIGLKENLQRDISGEAVSVDKLLIKVSSMLIYNS